MRPRARATAILILGAALALGGGPGGPRESPSAAPTGPAPTARFEPPLPGSYELPPFGHVRDHELLGPDGAPTALLALGPGDAALVGFVYLHCPDACPVAMAVFQEVDRMLAERPELAARVTLVTVSFDPARDTPERMASLRRALDPQGRWRFLTAANPAGIEPVLSDFGQDLVRVADAAAPPEVVSHMLKVFLVDGAGRLRNIYSSGFLDARILLNDLLTVLHE